MSPGQQFISAFFSIFETVLSGLFASLLSSLFTSFIQPIFDAIAGNLGVPMP